MAPAAGQKSSPTTPHEWQMNMLKSGWADCAQAERAGNPSRKGSPMAKLPAPRRKARRLTLERLPRLNPSFMVYLHWPAS
jgi:hypothetical protein